MEKLNVAIADDNERIVEILNALIRTENEMEVVGTAGNGEDAVEMMIADGVQAAMNQYNRKQVP